MIRGNVTGGNSFIENQCQIFGRYGDKVYQRKRNGEQRIYDYVYKQKYAATELSRRSNCIARTASVISNPQYKGYRAVINKLYYYTPYFLHSGDYSFTCNTFLKLRSRGDFTIEINGIKFGMQLCPRTKLKLSFDAGQSYTIRCFRNNLLYCTREVIVLAEEADLENAYSEWYQEHLAEILSFPEPAFASLTLYRRGIQPPNIYRTLSGKTPEGVLYESGIDGFSYVRSSYQHQHSFAGDHYYNSQSSVTACWNAVSSEFRQVFKKYHELWLRANFERTHKATKVNNLWSKVVFKAAAETGIDPEELSPENWLPGVETLGDLLDAAFMDDYGMSEEELNIRIY